MEDNKRGSAEIVDGEDEAHKKRSRPLLKKSCAATNEEAKIAMAELRILRLAMLCL